MKVRLNLATAPLENNRRFILGAVLLGVAGLAALGWLGRAAYLGWRENRDLRADKARLETEITQLRNQRRDLAQFFNQPDTRKVLDRAEFLNALIQQRSFPWTQIFMDLERLLPAGVRVISISPVMDEGRVEVRLTVGAGSDETKIKFLQTLEKAGEFSRLQVVSETRPNRPGEADAVVVELVAWYAAGMR